MSTVSVCWSEGSLDGDKRSRYADAGLLNETFDAIGNFIHYTPFSDLPIHSDGAVFIIHGGNQHKQLNELVQQLDKLKWALVIVFCDDESQFDTRRLIHPNRIIWQQMPIPGRHDFTNRRIICGYPGDCPQYTTQHQLTIDRPLNWFFSGQVNHSRRYQCVEQLARRNDGFLMSTAGFWQGLTRPEYYAKMISAKLVVCPAGPVTPDTLRMAEALEAGCVPIIDPKPGARVFPDGFWPYVLGENPPFAIVQNWTDLPRIMDEELAKWPENKFKCMEWWQKYKKSWQEWMVSDIQELQRRTG